MQSEEYLETPKGVEMSVGSNQSEIDTVRNRVYMGEQVRSLRSLLRRSNLLDVATPGSNTTDFGAWALTQRRYPPHFGYDFNGIHAAKGVTNPATTYAINFVSVTPYHYISNCFIAQKGAMHWHYNWDGPNDTTIRVSRLVSNPSSSVQFVGAAPGSYSVNAQTIARNIAGTAGGAALINQKTIAGVSVSMPNYTVYKFQTTDPTRFVAGSSLDGSDSEAFRVEINNNGPVQNLNVGRLERYFGVGTDFNLYFFLNCPTLHVYNAANMTAV
jgi:hypothetical protein